MNTGAPQQIGPNEFLRIVNDFHQKCSTGKQIPSEEVHHFYEIIKAGAEHSTKESAPIASKTSDPGINQKIAAALQALRQTIGRNNAVLMAAASGLKTDFVKQIDHTLERYASEQKRKTQTVQRKDKPTV